MPTPAEVKKYGGIEVQRASAPDQGLVLGIFAPGGTGKTTAAASITHSEHGGPALLLNMRSNPRVISSYGMTDEERMTEGQKAWPAHKRVDVMDLAKFNQNEDIRQDIIKEGDKFPYKSIIIDNVSEMFYVRLRELYGPITDVGWEKHSASTADVLQMVRNWVEMAEHHQRLNIIFLFQEVTEDRTVRGEKINRTEMAANKALQGQVPSIVNFFGRLYIYQDTKPFNRVLDFTPAEKVQQSKWQVDPRHPVAGQVPMEIYQPDLGDLLDTIRYNKPWPAEKHQKIK